MGYPIWHPAHSCIGCPHNFVKTTDVMMTTIPNVLDKPAPMPVEILGDRETLTVEQTKTINAVREVLRDGLDLYESGLRFNVTKALQLLRQLK